MKNLGNTRSCQKPNHLLQTPDTFIRAPLAGMQKATAIVHAARALGAGFIEYTAEIEAGGSFRFNRGQHFVYVISGAIRVHQQSMSLGGYCYLPPGSEQEIYAEEASALLIIEKKYQPLPAFEPPGFLAGSVADIKAAPLLGDPAIQVQMLLPETPAFDFAVNLMTFDPGASLPMVEIHVMEHGLMMLEGEGVYRLGDCWHPVAGGDFIWMAPYCPQWFGALGKQPARYLLYKDLNRAPAPEEPL